MARQIRYYHLGATALAIESDVDQVLTDCDRLYGGGEPIPDEIHFTIRRNRPKPWSRAAFVIHSNGEDYVAGPDIHKVIPQLEGAVNHQVSIKHSDHFQLHAAAMSFGDGAAVFVGSSGTGKTTLAAALLTRGWKYYCDEFALIAPHSLVAYPCPKALCIKEHGFSLIEQMGLPLYHGCGFCTQSNCRIAYLIPTETGADILATPRGVKHVFLMTRRANVPLRMNRISGPEAAMAIYRLALNTEVLRQKGFDAAVALANRANCYELNLGSVDESCALVESVVEDGAVHHTACQHVA